MQDHLKIVQEQQVMSFIIMTATWPLVDIKSNLESSLDAAMWPEQQSSI